MIRPTTPDDTDAILALAVSSGLFPADATEEVAGVLASAHRGELGPDHVWLTDDDGGPVGVAYFAPERMTDGTWNLYMLEVHPDRQRQGRGAALVRYVADGMPPLVESKWAWMGVFLHPVDKSAYGTDFAYYRSPRSGHVLSGLQTPSEGPTAP